MSKHIKIPEKVVYVCTGSKCKKRGGKELSKSLKEYIKSHKLSHIQVIKTDCTDNCKFGPVLCMQPANEWHYHSNPIMAIELLKNNVIE